MAPPRGRPRAAARPHRRPEDLKRLDDDAARSSSRRRCASTSSTRSGRSAATSAPTSAPASWRSRCTACSTRRATRSSGTWATRPIPHKVLTGRRDELPTIRKYGGLAPFCSREESAHDIMGAGHASTAASYAVGIKEAMRKRRQLGIAPRRTSPDATRCRGRRRRRDDGRRQLRGAAERGRARDADRDRAERQRHVDLTERRRAVALLQPPAARTRKGYQAREAVESGPHQAARRHRRARSSGSAPS